MSPGRSTESGPAPPNLHNGSVPTLRHLLAPHNDDSRRPGAFVRGSVSYDRLFVGFEWDPRVVSTLKAFAPTAVVFDTGWDSTSNHGHDRDFRRPKENNWSTW